VRVHATQEEAFGPGSRERDDRVKGGFDPRPNTLHLVASNMEPGADLNSTHQHEIFFCECLGFFAAEDVAPILEAIRVNAPQSKTLGPLRALDTPSTKSPASTARTILARLEAGSIRGCWRTATKRKAAHGSSPSGSNCHGREPRTALGAKYSLSAILSTART
jgi:hypothetical protein